MRNAVRRITRILPVTLALLLGFVLTTNASQESNPVPSPTPAEQDQPSESTDSDPAKSDSEESGAQEETATEATAAEPEEESADEDSSGKESSSSDGRNWITDEETQRRYSIEKIPKVEGTYIRRDENHIRLPGGLFRIEVVREDDDWFWIKLWEREPLKHRKPVYTPPSEEELEEVRSYYRAEGGEADRIRFEPFDDGLPTAGQWRQGFDIADMNGDGHLDIVFGPSRKGRRRPNIFLGDGAGHWRFWSQAKYPSLPYDYGDAEAADFNGDGHQDVLLSAHLAGLVVLVGDGEGGFEPWSEGLELKPPASKGGPTNFSSRAVESIDWNGDGRLDIIALGEGPKGVSMNAYENTQIINTSSSFAFFENHGDGTWSRGPLEQVTGDFGDDFTFGSFDEDDRTDLVLASRRRGNRGILRLSDGAKEGELVLGSVEPPRARVAWTSVDAVDLDGNGIDEVLAAYLVKDTDMWFTGIDLFERDSEGQWNRRAIASQEARVGLWSMAVGNLDGDGFPDVFAASSDGRAWVLLGDGQGSFIREVSPEFPPAMRGCAGSDVHLVDLDGDGRDEVVASYAGEGAGPKGLPGVVLLQGCSGGGRINAWKVSILDQDAEPAS